MNFRKIRAWDTTEKIYRTQGNGEKYLAFIKRLQSHVDVYKTKFIIEECTEKYDKNERLIYVGDVVEFTIHEHTMTAEVVYSKEHFSFGMRLFQNNGLMLLHDFKYPITILGNIHEG